MSQCVPISARDLEGVGPSGYLVPLLNDRLLHGPRWILARVRMWQPESDPLREVRERLLGLGAEELRELLRILRGN